MRTGGSRPEDLAAAQAMHAAGASSYYTTPRDDLDPRLFSGDVLREDVRAWVLDTILGWMREAGLREPEGWLRVWIAGSGITSLWAAYDVGDLDVLLGVVWPAFFAANPQYANTPHDYMASQINQRLHDELWPRTEQVWFPDWNAPLEATWYINAQSSDIRNINPYAAYDVRANTWTVRGPELPEDWHPETYLPLEWQEAAERDIQAARGALGRMSNAASAGEQSAAIRDALAAWERIHGERQRAFGQVGGKGFFAYENFRYQAAKRAGIAGPLRELAREERQRRQRAAEALYGGPILSGEDALWKARGL